MTTKDILDNYVDEINLIPIVLNYKYDMEHHEKFMKVMDELKAREFIVEYEYFQEDNYFVFRCSNQKRMFYTGVEEYIDGVFAVNPNQM